MEALGCFQTACEKVRIRCSAHSLLSDRLWKLIVFKECSEIFKNIRKSIQKFYSELRNNSVNFVCVPKRCVAKLFSDSSHYLAIITHHGLH